MKIGVRANTKQAVRLPARPPQVQDFTSIAQRGCVKASDATYASGDFLDKTFRYTVRLHLFLFEKKRPIAL
jgi:hypothetical protein